MPLRTVSTIAVRGSEGKSHLQHVYKPAVVASSTAGGWVDASMSAGTPIYNAWVGGQLESTALIGEKNKSIFTGQSGSINYLNSALFQVRSAVVPAYVMVLDYLMFYPLIDLDSTDLQETVVFNTLPRYESGEGVMAMPVITLPSTAVTNLTVVYTNSLGVGGRTVTFRLLQGTTVGSISASPMASNVGSQSPFMPLAAGDRGVRSIESVQLAGGVGGFLCMVLVKPLATVVIPEINTCSEVSFVGMKNTLPKVYPGAFLQFIVKTQVAAASSWMAQLNFTQE